MQTYAINKKTESKFENNLFLTAYRSGFSGILRWEQLDKLWETLRSSKSNWYIYAIGENPPASTSNIRQLDQFISEIDILLREEHKEDYCGIVYADDFDSPSFIKIYDPNNLGVVCGFSNNPPLPGWVLSTIKPVDLKTALPLAGNRQRWWEKIFKV